MKINPLIAIPSPRDLQEFQKSIDTITQYDKLWVKYCPAPFAYPRLRDEFLAKDNLKYTHLIICPDDLIIEKDKLQILIDDYQYLIPTTKEEQNTTVISGFCNVDTSDHSKEANICLDYVTPRRLGRRYKWVKLTSIAAMKGQIERKRKDKIAQETRLQQGQDKIIHYDEENPLEFQKQFLLPVKFAGFGMIMIPRAILQKVDLRNDARAYPDKINQGCCEDVMFCHQCLQRNYKILVDIRAQFKHLKFNDVSTMELIQMKDKEDPYLRYEYADDKKNTTTTTKTIPISYDHPVLGKAPKPAHYIYESYSH